MKAVFQTDFQVTREAIAGGLHPINDQWEYQTLEAPTWDELKQWGRSLAEKTLTPSRMNAREHPVLGCRLIETIEEQLTTHSARVVIYSTK